MLNVNTCIKVYCGLLWMFPIRLIYEMKFLFGQWQSEASSFMMSCFGQMPSWKPDELEMPAHMSALNGRDPPCMCDSGYFYFVILHKVFPVMVSTMLRSYDQTNTQFSRWYEYNISVFSSEDIFIYYGIINSWSPK